MSRPRCDRPVGGRLADTYQLLTIWKGVPLQVQGEGRGAIQHQGLAGDAPIFFRGQPLAPLLEQEGHAGRIALVAQAACPAGMHSSRARADLATDDYPVQCR